MAELISLITVGVAVVCIVLAIGSRDRMRTLEFRLALIERRIREGQPESSATPPATPDPRAAPESSIAPQPAPLEVASEPVSPDAAPPPLPPAEPASPPPVAAAARPRPSLEERFGTQWVVWAGGFAVACGGFFMLRLSIEQGWFGPGTRVSLGALLALLLIAAGEWTRRKELITGIAGIASAHIPSILTAAGTTIAYADIWAAYALYNFLAPGTAFILLGVVALARTNPRGSRPRGRVRHTRRSFHRSAKLLGAVRLSHGGKCSRDGTGTSTALALARRYSCGLRRAVDAAGLKRLSRGLADAAQLPCRCRICAGRDPARLRPVAWTRRRAGQDRADIISFAGGVSSRVSRCGARQCACSTRADDFHSAGCHDDCRILAFRARGWCFASSGTADLDRLRGLGAPIQLRQSRGAFGPNRPRNSRSAARGCDLAHCARRAVCWDVWHRWSSGTGAIAVRSHFHGVERYRSIRSGRYS